MKFSKNLNKKKRGFDSISIMHKSTLINNNYINFFFYLNIYHSKILNGILWDEFWKKSMSIFGQDLEYRFCFAMLFMKRDTLLSHSNWISSLINCSIGHFTWCMIATCTTSLYVERVAKNTKGFQNTVTARSASVPYKDSVIKSM